MNLLLVEDNPADMRLLKDLLEELPHPPSLDWVTDGNEAMEFILHQKEHKHARVPDVILLDLGLPRISGYEVLKELKQYPDYADIPVVVLTTSRSPFDREQCAALGADMFLSKPHNLKGYEDLVAQLINLDLPNLTRPPRNLKN